MNSDEQKEESVEEVAEAITDESSGGDLNVNISEEVATSEHLS